MKAIVTIIDEYGRIIEADKIITPIDEIITSNSTDSVTIKTTVFRFGITEALNQYQWMKEKG